MANILQLIGLVFDLIGVLITAYGIINIDKRIGTFDGIEQAKQIAEQVKFITIIGLIFIGAGFLLQSSGTIINICHTM